MVIIGMMMWGMMWIMTATLMVMALGMVGAMVMLGVLELVVVKATMIVMATQVPEVVVMAIVTS